MKVEKAILKDGKHTAVLFDDEYNIVGPVLIFTNWLQQKGSSPNTVLSYVHDLKVFFEWLEHEGLAFHQVKPAYMPRFIKFVDEQGKKVGQKSAATINRYLAAVSSMYRHFEVLGGYPDLSPLVTYKGRRPIEIGKKFSPTYREQEDEGQCLITSPYFLLLIRSPEAGKIFRIMQRF